MLTLRIAFGHEGNRRVTQFRLDDVPSIFKVDLTISIKLNFTKGEKKVK